MTPRPAQSTRGPRSFRPLGLAAAAAGGILLIYLLHPALHDFRLPIGPDGPVYTWLARLAEASGFGDAPGGGPGVPALTLALGSVLRTETVETVTLLGPVLAAAAGLAGGALLEACLGHDPIRALAGAILTGAFAAFLAGGWLANVAMVAVFLVALAVLSNVGESYRSLWAGMALLAAGGLGHRIFIVIGALILLGAAGWRLLQWRRGNRPREEAITALRLGAAAVTGPLAALLLGAWIGVGPRVPGDTSQDGFLRRTNLRGLLLDRYRERFLGETERAWPTAAAGFGLAAPWAFEKSRGGERETFLRDVVMSWALLSVAGVVILLMTGWGPPYRIIQFAFFLPVAAAAGFAILARRSRVIALVSSLLAVAFVGASMVGWFRQTPAFAAEEVAAAGRAGAVASALPARTPLVFLVDTDQGAAGYHVARAANVIRMGVPAERIRDIRIAVGQPDDLLNGRPTITGDPEHDRISEVYLDEVAPLLDDAAIFVLERFNPEGFVAAGDSGQVLADGVVALARNFEGAADVGRPLEAAPVKVPAPTGLSAPELVLLSLASLVLLGLLGWGWAKWMLAGTGMEGVALAAPSIGIAVAILSAVAADRIGLLPASPGALGVVGSVGVAGYFLAARRD